MRLFLVLALSLVLLGSAELPGSARAATDPPMPAPIASTADDATVGLGSDFTCVRCLGRRGAGGNRCMRLCHY